MPNVIKAVEDIKKKTGTYFSAEYKIAFFLL